MRPTIYSRDFADDICKKLAEGQSLRQICAPTDMPCKTTVLNWLLKPELREFLVQYKAARDIQLDVQADELEDLVTLGENEEDNAVKIARARLRADTRKWRLSKLAPKKYGDRPETEDTPLPEMPNTEVLTPAEVAMWLALKRKIKAAQQQ